MATLYNNLLEATAKALSGVRYASIDLDFFVFRNYEDSICVTHACKEHNIIIIRVNPLLRVGWYAWKVTPELDARVHSILPGVLSSLHCRDIKLGKFLFPAGEIIVQEQSEISLDGLI